MTPALYFFKVLICTRVNSSLNRDGKNERFCQYNNNSNNNNNNDNNWNLAVNQCLHDTGLKLLLKKTVFLFKCIVIWSRSGSLQMKFLIETVHF